MLQGGGLWFPWQSSTDSASPLPNSQTPNVTLVDRGGATNLSNNSNHGTTTTAASTTSSMMMNIRDEAVDLVESTASNEDEIVERLLTQFPTYGSAACASQQGPNTPSDYYNYYWGFLHKPPTSLDGSNHAKPPGGGAPDDLDDDALEEAKQQQEQRRGNSKGGLMASRGGASPVAVVEEWDLEEQSLWKTPSSIKSSSHHHLKQTTHNGNVKTNSSSNNNKSTLTHSRLALDDRQNWMPDELCKQCYSCEVPFTVFRRRHHCRLCGQVFCNACSAYFVNFSMQQQQQQQQPQHHHPQKQLQPPLSPSQTPHHQLPSQSSKQQQSPSLQQQQPQHHQATTTTSAVAVASSPIRVCKLCYDQVAEKGGMVVIQTTFDDVLGTEIATANADHAASGTNTTGTSTTAPTTNGESFSSPDHRKRFRLDQQQRLFFSNATAAPVASVPVVSGTNVIDSNTSNKQVQDAAAMVKPQQEQRLLFLSASSSEGGGGGGGGAAAVVVGSSSSNASRNGGGKGVEVVVGRIAPNNKSAAVIEAAVANAAAGKSLQVDSCEQGIQWTGSCAADHMVLVAGELLRLHAPILWSSTSNTLSETTKQAWINKLLALATKCCATVDPNVKKGDLLDLRPYVKVKVIAGGSYRDCAYLSGVMFRKTVSHKNMAKEILNPRIMLLSGGIEFTRRENRIASLETLFEQEEKYMEILVGKILKHKPDVLLVGRSVSRNGQELLLKAGVVLVQYVKPSLLNRISRQTGATVISSTDHVMSQFGSNVLGRCNRFRLVTFRDNEIWVDGEIIDPPSSASFSQQQVPANGNTNITNKGSLSQGIKRRSIRTLLSDPELSNPERQAALAASKLGEGVIDGSEAVKIGLAARGVARNYIMLEGCPKHLGCTVVLRGSHRAALKQVKVVFRFLVNVAYNLKLETNYLRERSIRIRPDFVLEKKFAFSSSLCVDYGKPPAGKKVRPWNGGNDTAPRLESGEITAFDHQAILITSVWMTDKAQCCPAEVKGIVYYSMQDVALGQFLRDSCFNLSLRCQNPNCKKSVLDHSLSFVHNDGLLKITVEELDEELPPSPLDRSKDERDALSQGDDGDESEIDRPIATWTYCNHCKKVVSPLAYISDTTWKFSFGKFLEVFFYNRDAIMNVPEHQCSCQVQSAARLYFGCGKLAARFNYEPIRPFGVFVRRCLPTEAGFQKSEALRRLELISEDSSKLFVKFDKHLERVSREARSLFNSPVNRPEHLQTVLSELNRIGSDVDNAAKTLSEKISSAVDSCRQQPDLEAMNQALFQFPWSTRRFVFMLTSAWNERLSATGQAIAAMKKIASSASRSDGVIGQNVVGDPLNDSLMESMKRLRKLNEQYARYNVSVSDITQVLPTLPGTSHLQQDGDYEDEFDDPDASIDFADGVDADVLASRRRLTRSSSQSSSTAPSRPKPTKSLGTRRHEMPRSGQDTTVVATPPKPTGAGGAVKSAITRFFNRGGRDFDPNTVDLGVFAEGRPRLAPGVNGLVVPIFDEHLSTIIAYSLASVEYGKQFKYYSRHEVTAVPEGDIPGATDRSLTASCNTDKTDPQGPVDKRRAPPDQPNPTAPASPATSNTTSTARASEEEIKDIERRMLVRSKSHIKHTFRDFDEKGQVTCKFVCTTYWATQFHAVRQVFLSRTGGKGETSDSDPSEIEQSYVESLSSASLWDASGGKSGASFSKSSDGRFVIKCISRTELQMFLDCAPAYFEYLSKAFFHGLPTVLCKIVGVYQIGVHNRVTGKRTMEQVAVMANIFYDRKITRVFDLKGSLRGRFTSQIQSAKDEAPDPPSNTSDSASTRKNKTDWNDDTMIGETEENEERSREQFSEDDKVPKEESGSKTLLDGDFLEFTQGRPMPMTDRAKAVFQMSILNDTLFLSIINVLDYSILVGVDEENMELVVGIIDFMRQYDILKQMERVGKSLPMVVGSEAPTIIQPPLYKARFTNAMERYFMTVPCKWTAI